MEFFKVKGNERSQNYLLKSQESDPQPAYWQTPAPPSKPPPFQCFPAPLPQRTGLQGCGLPLFLVVDGFFCVCISQG